MGLGGSELTVHVLASVLDPSRVQATLLIFETLRVGFPKAHVTVWGNGLSGQSSWVVQMAAMKAEGQYISLPQTSHDAWIDQLVQDSIRPFWVVDTDVCLWEPVEDWFLERPAVAIAGRLEPGFHEEWTNSWHVERLHTALMYISPGALRARMLEWAARVPDPIGRTADFPMVRQHFVPRRSALPLFYDTCAGLWQAGIGTQFADWENEAFDHLHCGTYVHLIDAPSLEGLRQGHDLIFEDYHRAKGLWKEQAKYYEQRKDVCHTTQA
jgi:hypothetical protein